MNKKIILFIAILMLILISLVFFCCNTFKPKWRNDLPSICNIAREDKQFYYKSEEKSGSVPGMEYCFKCLQRDQCRKEVFGVDKEGNPLPVDYTDKEKLIYFNNCLNELK